METLATDVEQLIKDTAKKIFFKEGKLHATTQDIADAAGINRASIHYYYRSRKHLFDKVFEEAMMEFHAKLTTVIGQPEEVPFRTLIENLIGFLFERSLEHPFLELFLVAELNTNPEMKPPLLPREPAERRALLREYIAAEVAAGTMKPIEPEHFIVNLMSLTSFPFMAKPIVKNAIGVSEEEYAKFIAERKDVVLKQIFLDL
jgi:TetR/AcrR family transcriptional regulator